MSQERGFATSADSSGLLGTPRVWEQVWGFLRDDPRWRGFEMYPWRLSGMDRVWDWTEFLLRQAEDLGCNVVGIHGRTAGIHESYTLRNRLMMGVINALLLPTPDLIERYGSRVDYLLIHGPEVRLVKNRMALRQGADRVKLLYIENHIRPGALGAAVEVARELRQDRVNAGVMFDLVHYLNAYDHRDEGFRGHWETMLAAIEWASNQRDVGGRLLPFGIHLPLGTNPEDSLMIDKIDSGMWKELGRVVNSQPDVLVVLENQQAGMGRVYVDAASQRRQERRNRMLVDMMKDNGVI